MLGLMDSKKRMASVIEALKSKDGEDHDYSALMQEPMQMLMAALENKDVEGAINMIAKLHDIMHGEHNSNDYE